MMCHIEHMMEITIRDLHMKTGDWVRKAARSGGLVVLDRRLPVARILPFTEGAQGKNFGERPLVGGFAALPRIGHDSTRYLSEDRERA